MLLRAYRITDRLGIITLKTGAKFSTLAVEGAHRIFSTTQTGVGGILRIVLALLAIVTNALLWLLNHIWSLLRIILSTVVTVGAFVFDLVIRAAQRLGGTSTRVTRGGARAAGTAAARNMARRSAQTEIDVSVTEDPLRRQNRVLSLMVVGTLAVLVVVFIWATGGNNDDTPTIPGAVNLNVNADPVNTAEGENLAVLPVATPVPTATDAPALFQVGGSLAYVQREAGQTDIWAVPIGSLNPIRVIASTEDDRDPAWSPDGTRLAYASRAEDSNWDIYVYDLRSDTTTRLTFNLAFDARPRWSPDGEFLVYESYQAANHLDIFIMRSNGLEAPVRIASSESADFSPVWSPGEGRRIAFVSWRNGNQDIYVVSLETQEVINVTNTSNRNEDFPSWSPDGEMLAYSADEAGFETVFIQPADGSGAAQAFRRGRAPSWSPDGNSVVFAVDASSGTLITVAPYLETGVATEIIQAFRGATMPVWTATPLPAALINGGGLPLAVSPQLYTEQVDETGGDPPYRLGNLVNIDNVDLPVLSDRVNDSFNALRERVNAMSAVDFLGRLSDALWSLDHIPQPGEPNRNWLRTGRAFSFNRSQTGFPAPFEVVREDKDLATFWRIYVRVDDEAQSGQLGEPLRHMPWDFAAADSGDVEAYEQGGRPRDTIPEGYYIDLTQIAQDYGWEAVAAGSDWRANFNARNYWTFQKRESLDWYSAMREIYPEPQLGAWVPTPTPIAVPTTPPEEG